MTQSKDIRTILKKEKIYIALLVFILIMSAAAFLSRSGEPATDLKPGVEEERLIREKYEITPEKIKILMKEKKEVIIALNLVVMVVMFLFLAGLVLDGFLLFYMSRKTPFIRGPGMQVNWGAWDVCKAVIVFMAAGYFLVGIELPLAKIFPLIEKKKHFKMMINSSILDVVAILFVIYIVVVEYKNKLTSLGLTLTNFIRDTVIGIAGYVAAIPLIIGALTLVIWIANIANYQPPMEPIMKLFLEEKNPLLLLYSTLFATILGPILEEIFFRGFMYSAFKKKAGIIGAILLSSFLFSILHTNPIGFLPIMVLGILLALLYEKTGSLIPSIMVHMIHNTGMMTFVFIMKEARIG